MKEILIKAISGNVLLPEEIEKLVDSIVYETTTPEQISAIVGAISTRIINNERGVTAQEIANFAKSLKKYTHKVEFKGQSGFIDVCGTGGDCLGTFNISTTVAFVIASLGAKVAKHGSRAISSKSGSADVLEKLGVNIELTEDKIQDVFKETGMIFLYAPHYNTGMAKIKKIRNAIGVPTVFNLLGPFINPVELDYHVMGVYDSSKCELMINALKHLGLKCAFVIHGDDGLDELSTTCHNTIYKLDNGIIEKVELPTFEELGIIKAEIKDLQGGDSTLNAKIILDILNGKKGPKRDIVLLNSAAALVTCGIAKDFTVGIKLAKKSLDEGLALKTLERLKNVSR